MTGNKRFLLDTNIISAWLENDTNSATRIEDAQQIFIPVIVVGEMYYGARFSTKIEYNLKNISKVTSNYTILFVDEFTCIFYSAIKVSLRKKGKPIQENDIWIAAIAQQHKLILVTRDNLFKEIDDLQIEEW